MTYLGSGDPARRRTDYHPAWLDNLADDVTLEGSALDGAVQGAEAVRTIVVYIRTLYEYQEFNFAGPYGDNGFLEDYTAQIRGEPIGSVVLVTRNAAGQAQHIVANYRPRSSLLILSRLLGEKFAGTPYGEHFAASESLNGPMTASTQLQYDVQVSALLPAAGAPLPHGERPHWSPLPGQ